MLLSVFSIALASHSRQTGFVDVLGGLREHVAVHSQVFDAFQLVGQGPHRLRCVALAHLGGLVPAFGVINSTSAVIAAPPAVLDGRVVAG